ncbi:MAG: hypothetical protein AMS15_09480 [Planctomycetes bacterium DG_23]|nr:MAG: hypothetical protein AMS15_09480 [Planctomycetes bacterium DG_23]
MKSGLNILFVFNGRSLGGAERLATEVAGKISARCGLCLAAKCAEEERLSNRMQKTFSYVRSLSGLSRGEKAWEIARIVREEGVDVLHLTNIEEGLRREIKARVPLPVVETWHSIRDWNTWHSLRHGPLRRRAKRDQASAERADALIAVHKTLEEHIRNERPTAHSGQASIIKAIPCGVDTEKFTPPGKKAKVVGSCSRIVPMKNLEMFIRTAARVKARYENILFIIIGDVAKGDESYLRQLEELMAEKDLDIILTHHREDVGKWLNLLDVFLFTSKSEGMPLAVLEAMSCGLPVVATRVGGLGELIEQGKSGFLVDVDDDQGAGGKVLALLEDEEKAAEMGRKARQRILARYDLKEIAQKYEILFEEVCQRAEHERQATFLTGKEIDLPLLQPLKASEPKVSIIMCVSDLPQATRRAVEAVRRYTENYELIFVTDKRCSFPDWLKKEGRVILDDRQFNFARRSNIGIAAAAAANDIVLLNNDTEVTRGWLDCMRKVCSHFGGNVLIGARTEPKEAGNPDSWGPGPEVFTQNTINMFSAYIPRRLLQVVGLLDERFIYYGGDDSDYSLRILRHGFPLVVSSAFVHHRTGSSFAESRFPLQKKTEKIFREKWGVRHTEISRYARRPLVSVIMTNFNYGQYLARAIESILGQSYPHLELIIVDDGSRDDSHRVIEKYNARDRRIRTLYLHRQGYARARDAGLAMSNGEFFTEQDADDFSDEHRIERSLQEFWRDPALDMVYTGSLISEDDFKTTRPLDTGPWDKEKYLNDERFWVATSSILARRFVYRKVGAYDEDYLGVMDSQWLLRADSLGLKFGYLPEVLYNYRRHKRRVAGTVRAHLMWEKLRLEYADGKRIEGGCRCPA